MKLKFSKRNRKLKELAEYLDMPKSHVVSFDLPAGHSCPMANICLSKADRVTGKITDGENCQFRCYAASTECYLTSVRNMRWFNFDLLKASDDMVNLINESLPATAEVVRIHSSGDFFSKAYFEAWVKVAQMNPDIIFFGYTKVLQYVSEDMPENMSLVYSYGGKLDHMVTDEPVSYVVKTVEDAIERGITPACLGTNVSDDYDYIREGKSFALTIHGTQPAKA